MNIEQAYEKVNEVKPPPEVKALTLDQAEKAVRKMYRHLTGTIFPYPVVETSGNRVTWMHGGEYRVNVGNGWTDLVHLFSHWYHRNNFPGDRPHSKRHARIERKLRKLAVARGWMVGALHQEKIEAPAPTKKEKRAELILRRMEQITRLKTKIKGLTTRLKTAQRSLGALTRASAKAVQA